MPSGPSLSLIRARPFVRALECLFVVVAVLVVARVLQVSFAAFQLQMLDQATNRSRRVPPPTTTSVSNGLPVRVVLGNPQLQLAQASHRKHDNVAMHLRKGLHIGNSRYSHVATAPVFTPVC